MHAVGGVPSMDDHFVPPPQASAGLNVDREAVDSAFNSGSDGQKVNNGGKPATALRVELSMRKKKHLECTVTYAKAGAELAQTALDNAVAGDAVNALTSVRIKITSS